MNSSKNRDPLPLMVEAACVLEATAGKAGNVHPGAEFEDLSFDDFLNAARAIRDPLGCGGAFCTGELVLRSVSATRRVARSNPNLGIILLLAPLVAIPFDRSLVEGIEDQLAGLDIEDARLVYEAIRAADAGGMGEVASADLSQIPRINLREAMQLASDRDLIARQYASGFHDVLCTGTRSLEQWAGQVDDWDQCLVGLHLELLATHGDSLIARKLGNEMSQEVRRRATRVLELDWPRSEESRLVFRSFDDWLREDGHRRNPGSTADLVAAITFALFRECRLHIPDIEHVARRKSLKSLPVQFVDGSNSTTVTAG